MPGQQLLKLTVLTDTCVIKLKDLNMSNLMRQAAAKTQRGIQNALISVDLSRTNSFSIYLVQLLWALHVN